MNHTPFTILAGPSLARHRCWLSLLVLGLLVQNRSFAQQSTGGSVASSPAIAAFFDRYPGLRHITYSGGLGENLTIIFELDSGRIETGNLSFIGSRYLLERKWGAIPFTDSMLTPAYHLRALSGWVQGSIQRDSIRWRMGQVIPPEAEFGTARATRPETPPVFLPGSAELEERLNRCLDGLPPICGESDSVFIFWLQLEKDSSVKKVRTVAAADPVYALAFSWALNALRPWSVRLVNGRRVRTYVMAYIRLRPDGRVNCRLSD